MNVIFVRILLEPRSDELTSVEAGWCTSGMRLPTEEIHVTLRMCCR